jgi:hypothetical protein
MEAGPTVVARYTLLGAFASGGMGKVHLGRLLGPVGFSRWVAIKRLHLHLAEERATVAMFTGGCDPLFTIDSSGIKVPKPNCIR